MRPEVWRPPVELSADEEGVVGLTRERSRLFVFLRRWRHELLDEPFQRELVAMYTAAGGPELSARSLKAALDVDWDDPTARTAALARVLSMVTAVAAYAAEQGAVPAATTASLAVADQVERQDVVRAADGAPALGQGVARDRRLSVEDGEMRHGRNS